MFRYDFSKPNRSMLGKHREGNVTLESKSIVEEMSNKDRSLFSASRSRSHLERRTLNENSLSVKSPFPRNSFQHNIKKNLFSSGRKPNKSVVNSLPQENSKKCLFSSGIKENCDPYDSKRNYETSLADVTGITDLPLLSASRPKSCMVERARKRSQSKQYDDYIEMLKKKFTPCKTPKSACKDIKYNDKTGMTPSPFVSFYSTLKPPTPPDSMYEAYLQKRFRNNKLEEQSLTGTVKKPDITGNRLPLSSNKSPKIIEMNSAQKKCYHKSWENISTITRSPIRQTSASKRIDYSSLDNLATITKSKEVFYTSTANKKYDHTSRENINEVDVFTNYSQSLNCMVSLDSLYATKRNEVNLNSTCEEVYHKNSWENISVISNATSKADLDCTNTWENSTTLTNIQSIKKGSYLSGYNGLRKSYDDKLDFQKTEIQDASGLNKFNFPANSTAIEESENFEDSFVFNEHMTLIEEVTQSEKKKQLSVVPEESTTMNSLSNAICGQSASRSCKADLTLVPIDDETLCCKQTHTTTDNLKTQSDHSYAFSMNLLQTNIETMVRENIELLASFQVDVLNEYSIKLKERLNDIVKEQTVFRNKAIQSELENVLEDKLNIFKDSFKIQHKECTELLDQLKSRLVCETSGRHSTNKNKVFCMKSEADRIMEESEKLVKKLKNDVVQDFQNQMSLGVNRSIQKQIDAISNTTKVDLEEIVLVKWESVAQQIELRKQKCLSHVESLKNSFDKDMLEYDGKCNELEEKVGCLQMDLNSLSNINNELVNDYRDQILSEFQNKIAAVSKNTIEQETEDISNTFQTSLQQKLDLFIPKLNSQTEKWLSFKINVMKNIESLRNSENDSCADMTSVQIKEQFKSHPKIESTRKMYSELKSGFRFCLKTPEASRKKSNRFSHNMSKVLTPRTMSGVINDQINNLLDS